MSRKKGIKGRSKKSEVRSEECCYNNNILRCITLNTYFIFK